MGHQEKVIKHNKHQVLKKCRVGGEGLDGGVEGVVRVRVIYNKI